MATKKAKKVPKPPKAKKSTAKKPVQNPRASRIVQNEQTRPADKSATGQVWAIADKITAAKRAKGERGAWATRAEVVAAATAKELHLGMTATQFQRWRVFNGVPVAVGEGSKSKKAKAAPKAPKAPKAKKAAKAKPAKKAAKKSVPKPPKAPVASAVPPPPPSA